EVGVDDAAGLDRALQHRRGGPTTRIAEHDRDRAAQDDVDAPPDLAPGAVVVDVLFELVALGEDLTDRRHTEGHRVTGAAGAATLADLGHPSSLGHAATTVWGCVGPHPLA